MAVFDIAAGAEKQQLSAKVKRDLAGRRGIRFSRCSLRAVVLAFLHSSPS
jgi:hypothetical protein